MLQTLKNAWRTREIRTKILFTLFIVLLYRFGTVVPVPFVDANVFKGSFQGTILDYMDLLSGGSLGNTTLFALGVSPYINASIIIQLLAVVFPNSLGEIAKNDKKKMSFITRIVTVILALVTSIGYYFLLSSNGALTNDATKGEGNLYWFYAIVIIMAYCAGASLVMWLAERINDRGIGNGISIILFANIIARGPAMINALWSMMFDAAGKFKVTGLILAIVSVALTLAIVVLVVWFTNSERRIPVQYAKRVVGRKMYGGQSSNLPLKLNMAGVMPVIFANSIVSIPGTLAMIFSAAWIQTLANDYFQVTKPLYVLLSVILLFAFAYFYILISFNPVEVANNIRNNGGAVPGIRPGKPTSDYIRKILNRITLIGAVFLCAVSELPKILVSIFATIADFNTIFPGFAQGVVDFYNYGANVFMTVAFSGTSVLIVVGVILETVRELEAQLTMRNYKGFLD